MTVQTPLARAEGLGAAHSGTHHFWRQRVSAIALIPLTIWFCITAIALIGADRNHAVVVLARPVNAIAMALFVISAVHHMALGVQVVIEDYVHQEGAKIALLVTNRFFAWLVGAACLFALAKIAL